MKEKSAKDSSTEGKIIEAARKVFTRKGYAATRTRDIAEEAGINLALLNYYYRSKEKLFGIVIEEKFKEFFGVIANTLHNDQTTLQEKVNLLVDDYINLLVNNQDLPLFILSEIRNHPGHFAKLVEHVSFTKSSFWKQMQEAKPDISVFHFLVSLLGMIVFPFVGRPILEQIGAFEKMEFESFVNERKKLIPIWIKAMLDTK